MLRPSVSCLTVLAVLAPVFVQAQAVDLSGTWRLDEERSRVRVEATLAGLMGAGAPQTLHITQPSNGTLVVESQINESYARLYVPGEKTSTPIFLGEPGSITMTSRWEGGALVSEGTRKSPSSTGNVREVFALSEDGRTLEVDISLEGADGDIVSALRYTRIRDVGPCESWPTPCKDPMRPRR